MSTLLLAGQATPLPPIIHSRRWISRAWALFRGTPVSGWLLAMFPLACELVIQLGVPVAGTVLSKVLVPLAGAWALALVHRRATRHAYQVRVATMAWARRIPALLLLAAFTAVLVFGLQMLVLASIAGTGQARAAAVQDMHLLDLARWQVAVMLVSGVLPSLALLFAQAQVLLGGMGARPAIVHSLRTAVRWRLPLLPIAGIAAALLLAAAWMPLVLLVLPVVFLYLGYAAWEDVCGTHPECHAG